MASVKTLQTAFNGGELSPTMHGRISDVGYQNGLAKCRNFIVRAQGAVESRAGLGFVREVKNSAQRVRLIPFTFASDETRVIEMGAGYFRFHTDGETLMDGNVPYEIGNDYDQTDLFDIHHVQSADVFTLVHPKYPPMELRRTPGGSAGETWTLVPIQFAATVEPPVTPTLQHTPGQNLNPQTPLVLYDTTYVVTAVDTGGISESAASPPAMIQANLFATGATVRISWQSVAGASRYNVYKLQGGLFGYIGQTNTLSLVDDNIGPDMSKTPPIYDTVFRPSGILSVEVTNGGNGYGTQNTGGGIASVVVTNGGSGYDMYGTGGFQLTVSDPTGTGAVLAAALDDVVPNGGTGAVLGVIVTNPGTGYTNPTIAITDPDAQGSGAAFQISLESGGSVPTLKVTDPTGSGAVLRAVVENNGIVGVVVDYPGQDYSNPVVSVDNAAGGSGATFGVPDLGSQDFPGAVSYFEQRRVFAGTLNSPQSIWMTRSGTESNMSYSLPIRDDDRINFRVAAREANTIRHIVPLGEMLIFTSAAEWRVTSVNSDAITPTSISVKPHSYIGASNVQPAIVNNSVVYVAARGGHMREIGQNEYGSYMNGDLSLRAAHLFDNFQIADMAYAKAPQPIVWCVSSNGKLLGLTYVPEQQVGAWHWHDTDGTFESCCVVPEGNEDVLYVVVRRWVNGVPRRYVERMASRQFTALEDAFFVDSGVTYGGAPADEISGLNHLEGKTVSILADGAVQPQQVVTGGKVTIPVNASKIHIGLPITAEMQTLPLVAQVDNAYSRGRNKNVNAAYLRVLQSSGVWVGASLDSLTEYKQRTTEPYNSAPSLVTDVIEVVLSPEWGEDGQIFIQQKDPVPLTVTSLALDVTFGG